MIEEGTQIVQYYYIMRTNILSFVKFKQSCEIDLIHSIKLVIKPVPLYCIIYHILSCITQCNLNERIISDTQLYLHVSYELTFFLSQKTDSSLSIQVFYSWKVEYKRFIVTVMSFLQISNTFLRKPC